MFSLYYVNCFQFCVLIHRDLTRASTWRRESPPHASSILASASPWRRRSWPRRGSWPPGWAGRGLATCTKAVREQVRAVPRVAYKSRDMDAGPAGGSSEASSRKLTSPRRGGSWLGTTAAGEGLLGESGVWTEVHLQAPRKMHVVTIEKDNFQVAYWEALM